MKVWLEQSIKTLKKNSDPSLGKGGKEVEGKV